MLFPHCKRVIADEGLIKPGEHVVVAVSGGIDSMVLFHLLLRLKDAWGLSLTAAHYNHLRRGRDSLADEALVERVARECGVPFRVQRAQTKTRGNVQEVARNARRAFFSDIAAALKAHVVALAHHQGDQAETILLHLIRGAGLAGLTGMQRSDRLGNTRLIRPLLGCTHDEIAAYAAEQRIPFRHDATNATRVYRRNDVRLRLIPLLAELNPRIVATIAGMGERLAHDEAVLALLAARGEHEVVIATDEQHSMLARKAYLELPRGLRLRILMATFDRLTAGKMHLNADQLNRMDFLAAQAKRGSYRLTSPWRFACLGHYLRIDCYRR